MLTRDSPVHNGNRYKEVSFAIIEISGLLQIKVLKINTPFNNSVYIGGIPVTYQSENQLL